MAVKDEEYDYLFKGTVLKRIKINWFKFLSV